jgi:hypothetical protein
MPIRKYTHTVRQLHQFKNICVLPSLWVTLFFTGIFLVIKKLWCTIVTFDMRIPRPMHADPGLKMRAYLLTPHSILSWITPPSTNRARCGLTLVIKWVYRYQVAGFDPRSQMDLRLVWKSWLFFLYAFIGGMFSSTANEIITRLKFASAKAKVFPHLMAWVLVGRGIPQVKGHNSVLRLWYSKE